MKRIIKNSPLGIYSHYYSVETAMHAPSIRALLEMIPSHQRLLDREGVLQYINHKPDGERTCFAGVRKVPDGMDLYRNGAQLVLRSQSPPALRDGTLIDLLQSAVQRLIAKHNRVALALSGGLDSALVLALSQREASIPVCTLVTRFHGYCELDRTIKTAKELGLRNVWAIEADETDFIEALPQAIGACETPLYNFHPISKFLLARALRRQGFGAVITGDGADQVFAGADGRNYLPIVGALVRSAGLELLSPFLDEEVIAFARTQKVDPDKTVLRQAAADVLPREIAWLRKVPRLAPDMDLARYWDANAVEEIRQALALPQCNCDTPAAKMVWTTLTLLSRQLRGGVVCAA